MSGPRTFGELPPSNWPGERLGLPKEGVGSVARAGRRIGALCVDYALACLVVFLIWPPAMLESTLWPLVSFGILNVLGIVLLGGSPGHRLFRMYVAAIDGTIVGLKRATIRTGLLLLVIPALVWDSDQRGFHDKVAGTVLLRQ